MQIPYKRRNDGRIDVMLKNYQFFGKTVLDIGCNTGHITNVLHSAGASIVGIDSDQTAIAIAQKKYPKCDFFTKQVTAEFIRSLALKYDCMLLLAVLQHLVANMGCYKQETGMERALEFMKAIRSKTDYLWFEMAYPNEVKRAGAIGLPQMKPNPDKWIIDNILLPAGFENIQRWESPELMHHKFQSYLHRYHYHKLVNTHQWVRNICQFDDRDKRSLFLVW